MVALYCVLTGMVSLLLVFSSLLQVYHYKMKTVKKYTATILLLLTLVPLIFLVITDERWNDTLEPDPHSWTTIEGRQRNDAFIHRYVYRRCLKLHTL